MKVILAFVGCKNSFPIVYRIKDIKMTKKNSRVLIVVVILFFSAVLGVGVAALCGAFDVDGNDYVRVSGSKYSKALSGYVSQIVSWDETVIVYQQNYADGQIIKRRTEEVGSGKDGYEMYHVMTVSGLGDYAERCSYCDGVLIKVTELDGEDIVSTESIESVNRFAEIKKEFSGDCKKYLMAFTSDIFSDIYVLRQGDETLYKVDFDDKTTQSIMGANSKRLQLLVSVKNGKTVMLRFMYDKQANPSLSDDSSSSVILEFSQAVDKNTWEDLKALADIPDLD